MGMFRDKRSMDYIDNSLKPNEVKMNNDPWKHRSKGMRCSTCMWFAFKQVQGAEPLLGRCRRHSPTMNGYPVVFPTDWCGDHKLDEEKMSNESSFIANPLICGDYPKQ